MHTKDTRNRIVERISWKHERMDILMDSTATSSGQKIKMNV